MANTLVAGTVTVSANASDTVGVSKVEFYVDNALKNTDTASPYAFSWDTTNGSAHPCNGAHTHTLSAKAYDGAGNVGTSANVVVNMNNPAYCGGSSSGKIPSGITPHNQTSQWIKGEIILTNAFNMGDGQVLYDPSDLAFPYKMWMYGWATEVCNDKYPGCDAIFYARSSNSHQWQVYAGKTSTGSPKFDTTMNPAMWVPVMTAQNKYFDQWHNGDPSVVKANGVYFMAYSALGFDKDGIIGEDPKDTDNDFLDVMGAVSSDGINWQRRTMPLLVSPIEYGALEPVSNTMYHRPSLMYEDGKFKIWFDYWADNTMGLSTGYAELAGVASSATFLNGIPALIRSGSNPVIAQWPNPTVIHVGSMYYSYADPPQYADSSPQGAWIARKITEAVSPDSINWTVTGYIDPESDCAADQIPEAYYTGDGNIYLTYGCFTSFDQNAYAMIKSIRRMYKPVPK